MAHTTLENLNASKGFHQLFVYVNDVTSGMFSRMVLFALFIIIALGSYFAMNRLQNKGNIAGSFAVAGFITSGAAIIMLAIDGLTTVGDVIVTIIISIACVAWLLLGNSSN